MEVMVLTTFRYRKYPLREVRINMNWIIDSGLHGCVYGERRSYEMWISVNDDVDVIKSTIAHELAHIHLKRFYTKTKGPRIFYSHGKLFKEVEQYYMNNWGKEINKLYRQLMKSTIDVYQCNKNELLEMVQKHFGRKLVLAARKT